MRDVAKRLTTRGLRRALSGVAEELALLRRHRAAIRKSRTLSLSGDLRVQLGSGGQPKDGWLNVDLFADSAQLHLDLREDLPFPDDSVSFVYTEHLFEHLDYPVDAHHLLREVRRILKPGGTLSIVVPDFGKALRAYASGDESFFTASDRLRSYLLRERATLMHHVNYWFRQDGHHHYAYDSETLAQVLTDSGFTSVRERAYDPELDSEKRYRLHSLYMEAVKPAATARQTAGGRPAIFMAA